MNKWSDPGQPIPYPTRNKEYESNLWTRAYYYEGLIDSGRSIPATLPDYALEWETSMSGTSKSAEGG